MGRTKRIRKRRYNFCTNEDIEAVVQLSKYLGLMGWKNKTRLYQKYFKTTGRGLYSRKNISEGDLIIQIPFDAMISLYTVESDEDFKDFLSPLKILKEREVHFQALLSLYVLFHKHQIDSKWSYYLHTIPKEFSNPLFCSKRELYFLPENILGEIVEQNRMIKDNYDIFQKAFEGIRCCCCNILYFPNMFPIDHFKWAYFAVNTRSVFIDLNETYTLKNEYEFKKYLKDEPSLGLAPILDLLNHSDHAKTVAKLAKKDTSFMYELYTCKGYKKYEQIFISYGNLTNFKLLIDYGFFLKGNIHDFFNFDLSDVENMIRSNISLRSSNIHRNKFKFIRDHSLDQQMFVHRSDGLSHNLKVVLYLIFKEKLHFPNVLNQVAFGSADLFTDSIQKEAKILLEYKIIEYEKYRQGLNSLENLSASGQQCLEYIEECIRYLKDCLNKFCSF